MNIDYPEYDDVEEMTHQILVEKATAVKKEIEALLRTSSKEKSCVKVFLPSLSAGRT